MLQSVTPTKLNKKTIEDSMIRAFNENRYDYYWFIRFLISIAKSIILVIPLIILNFVMPPEKEETYSNLAFAIYSVALIGVDSTYLVLRAS